VRPLLEGVKLVKNVQYFLKVYALCVGIARHKYLIYVHEGIILALFGCLTAIQLYFANRRCTGGGDGLSCLDQNIER
jgi:hypothetical protein